MSDLKKKVIEGTFWTLLERFGTHLVTFVLGIILARLLTPKAYGTVSMIAIFTAISNVLVESGFGSALVQKKDATELDFNSVFYAHLALSTFFYCILFIGAPWVGRFYEMPELAQMLRVTALSLFFHALNAVQDAELKKKMLFHLSFKISMISICVSMPAGVLLAYLGYGAWSLVWSGIASSVLGVVTRWLFIAWRPKLMFSFAALKGLFSYGWKLTVSSLLDSGYRNLYGLLVGKFYGPADLAFLHKGRHIPSLAMTMVNSTIGRVSFPALVLMQDDRPRLRDSMRRMMQCSTFIVFPLMTVVALTAQSSLIMLYGDKWEPSVKFMQVACVSCALWPFHTINLQAIQAMGKSDVFLILELIKKGIGICFIIAFLRFGVFAYAVISAFTLGPLSVIINSWPNRKLLNYTIGQQVKDVVEPLLFCIPMAVAMYLAGKIPLLGFSADWKFRADLFARICLQMAVGLPVFAAIALWRRPTAVVEYAKMLERPLLSKTSGSAHALLAKLFAYLLSKPSGKHVA